MEARLNMIQEENGNSDCSINSRHLQDRSIKRLQWIVACCVACLCILLCLTVYQILEGSSILCRKDKDHPDSPKPQGMYDNSAAKKPSAHLTGTIQSDSKAEELHWESKHGLAFLQDGMHYDNKSIEIPVDGRYFVYSKVSFINDCSNKPNIVQKIKKFNDNYPEPDILLSEISHCVNEKSGFQPIYLGGLFELKEGDKLKVTVSHIKLIDISVDHKTFFGAFWV